MINLPHSALIRLQKYTDNNNVINVIEDLMAALLEGQTEIELDTAKLDAEELKDLIVSLEELGYTVDGYYGANEIMVTCD